MIKTMQCYVRVVNETVKEAFAIDDIFIGAINDKNRNEVPDAGECVAFCWNMLWPLPLVYIPRPWDLTDGENHLDRSVRFTELFTMPSL